MARKVWASPTCWVLGGAVAPNDAYVAGAVAFPSLFGVQHSRPMALFATLLALSPALPPSIGFSGLKGLCSLPFCSLVWLSAGASALQAVGFLTNLVVKGVRINGRGRAYDKGRG